MLIIVSGFAGSGKSTLTEALAAHFGLDFVHASDLLKKLQKQGASGLDTSRTKAGSGFWESDEGKKYLHERQKDGSMDKELDRLLLKIAEKGNVVLDSWTMPWLCKSGFKIWLEVSAKERARRVAERDGLDKKIVLAKILERDKITAEIYKKLYGFDLSPDKKVFDLIIAGDGLRVEDVQKIAISNIEENYARQTNK